MRVLVPTVVVPVLDIEVGVVDEGALGCVQRAQPVGGLEVVPRKYLGRGPYATTCPLIRITQSAARASSRSCVVSPIAYDRHQRFRAELALALLTTEPNSEESSSRQPTTSWPKDICAIHLHCGFCCKASSRLLEPRTINSPRSTIRRTACSGLSDAGKQ